MSPQPLLRLAVACALPMLFGACTQQNTGDQQAQQAAAAVTDVALGVDRLLLFPNPIGTDPLAQNGGTFETDTTDYATAYYAAIDPNNTKDTIDKWRTVNGFNGFASPARPGTEHLAVFRDTRDLGYGRRMTARKNNDDGSIAFYVENYNVEPGGLPSYASTLNVDAAIQRDTRWHVGTNAIEWTTTPCMNIAHGFAYNYDPPDCDGTVKFAKYYNFSSADGTRQLAVDLDGRGKKAMPGPCITCHGGRGDPLTPQDVSGKPRFPLVENLPSRKRGDVGAHLHGQNVDSFSFSTDIAGFAKSDMQPLLKDFNQWIMCTYPWDPAGTTPQIIAIASGGTCTRQTAGANEWQGTAAEMIQAWYGGPGMPTQVFSDTYVPAGWNANAAIPGTTFTDTALYQGVVVPFCRTCHILRGTKNQDDLNFFNFGTPAVGSTPATGFRSYADRIKAHVFDRGNMPLALIPHSNFWNSPTAPQMLATFVDSQLGVGSATSNGMPLMPGRPIADPGPDRMVRTNANAVLTGENSLFASTFAWSEPTPSGHVTITNPNSMVAIFNADQAGTYTVRLTVDGGAFRDVHVTADDNFPDPLNIKFAHVKNVLQNITHATGKLCITCHAQVVVPAQVTTPLVPPIWYTSTLDRDSNGVVDATDDAWFLKALSGRVNLTEIEASALLRKPTGNHHAGLKPIDVTDTSSNGGLRNYSIIYNWILAGMQPGGAAANPVVSANNVLTFSGAPLFASIPLDGSSSIGATNFLWTVLPGGPSGPTGAVATISNPTSAAAVLNVPNTGTYVVRLDVDDGISSDAEQRSVTVSEAPIVASFGPQTGSVLVTFAPSTNTGTVTLTSTSSYTGAPGIPVSCRWQVTPPAGVSGTFLDGSAVLDLTKSCGAPATLTVPASAATKAYQVSLSAFTLNPSLAVPVSHTLTISSSAPTASLASTVTPQTLTFTSNGTNTNVKTNTLPNGAGTAGNIAIANVTANVQLNGGSSSTPPGTGTLTYSWCLSSQPDSANFPASIAICPAQTSSGASSTISMTVRATGAYGVELTVTNNFSSSTTAPTSILANIASGLSFQNTIVPIVTTCTAGCHVFGASTGTTFNTSPQSGFAPPWDNANTAEGDTLYQRIRQRVATTFGATGVPLLLHCPDLGCGNMPNSYHATFGTGSTNFNNMSSWITSGAPPGD